MLVNCGLNAAYSNEENKLLSILTVSFVVVKHNCIFTEITFSYSGGDIFYMRVNYVDVKENQN